MKNKGVMFSMIASSVLFAAIGLALVVARQPAGASTAIFSSPADLWLNASKSPHPGAQTGPSDIARINAVFASLAAQTAHYGRFWRSDREQQVQQTKDALQLENQARETLLQTLGNRAREYASLWPLFRPLQHRFPKFSSAQQIKIDQLERQFTLENQSATTSPSFGSLVEQISATLGSNVAMEYAIRTSPLAIQLRNALNANSEQEFRAVYMVLNALSSSEISQSEYIDSRQELRALLGAQRYTDLWSSRDPRFAAMQKIADRYELTDTSLKSAYALLNDGQDNLLIATTRYQSDPEIRASRIRELYDRQRQRLLELVGSKAGDALLHAFSQPPS